MGYDLSVDEMVAMRREANTPHGESVGPDFERMMEDIERILLPSEKTPISTAKILGQMELEFLEPVLKGFYKKTSCYPPLAMLRGVMLGKKKKLILAKAKAIFDCLSRRSKTIGIH